MNVFRPLRLKPFWLFIGMALVAAVIYLSLTASFPVFLLDNEIKFNHILAYTVLMFYFAQLIVKTSMVWLFAGFFVVMGIVLEYLQGMTGYRIFSYYDMFANYLGVSVGFVFSKTPLVNSVEYIDRKIARHF